MYREVSSIFQGKICHSGAAPFYPAFFLLNRSKIQPDAAFRGPGRIRPGISGKIQDIGRHAAQHSQSLPFAFAGQNLQGYGKSVFDVKLFHELHKFRTAFILRKNPFQALHPPGIFLRQFRYAGRRTQDHIMKQNSLWHKHLHPEAFPVIRKFFEVHMPLPEGGQDIPPRRTFLKHPGPGEFPLHEGVPVHGGVLLCPKQYFSDAVLIHSIAAALLSCQLRYFGGNL